MKRKIKRNQINPIYWFFIAGFLLGVLIPNIMWKDVYMQGNVVSSYLLESLIVGGTEKKELLYEVMKKRLGMALVTGVCGISIFGLPTAVLVIMLLAFEFGSILTNSILQFGVQGSMIGSVLLFPHGFLYITGMLGISTLAFRKSQETWRTVSVFNKELWKYLGVFSLYMILIAIGIWLEAYHSPDFVNFIVKKLGIFS